MEKYKGFHENSTVLNMSKLFLHSLACLRLRTYTNVCASGKLLTSKEISDGQ